MEVPPTPQGSKADIWNVSPSSEGIVYCVCGFYIGGMSYATGGNMVKNNTIHAFFLLLSYFVPGVPLHYDITR